MNAEELLMNGGYVAIKVDLKNPGEERRQVGVYVRIDDRIDFTQPLRDDLVYQDCLMFLFDQLRLTPLVMDKANDQDNQ